MKHVDHSSRAANSSENLFEIRPDYKTKNFKKELLPIILLISVGIIGTLYSFSRGFGKNMPNATSKITSNQIPNEEESVEPPYGAQGQTAQGNTALTAKVNQLSITGEKEARQLLTFSIENFDKKAKYDLHLGDGVVLHPMAKKIKYAYQNPGKYKVRLVVNYEGESAQLFGAYIQIAKAVEVASGAHQEN